MSGSTDREFQTLLIIGVHREELSFGRRVAAALESSGIRLLSVEHGMPRDRYRRGDFYHDTCLPELYLQIHQQIQGRNDLVIDLHTGVDDKGRLAEIYCHEAGLPDWF